MTNVVPLRAGFGATPDVWAHFELVVGPGDLLPVVSNPNARISPASTLKDIGKTPSTYNRFGQVVGIPKWSQHRATAADIEQWSQVPDHGICIQTRWVRALDIDIPDPELAAWVAMVFRDTLGIDLPCRSRQGTGKQLLAFVIEGDLRKRSFKVEGGLVEFLATGQQFIAAGTHPSGSAYTWEDGLPAVFPVVKQAAFEAAWAALVEQFALSPATEGSEASDRSRADLDGVEDPVVAYLEEHGLALGQQGEKVFVACPWKEGHSTDSGISETAWLVAGTRGFAQGHFQCMHASCQGRQNEDFLDAIGFRVAAFEDLGDAPEDADEDEGYLAPWPAFKRDKAGRIEATLENITKALERPDICGVSLAFDRFHDTLMVDRRRPFTDGDSVALRVALEQRGFKAVGRELARDALLLFGQRHEYDSAQDWLRGLPAWDGVPRVEGSMWRYFATDDTPYTRAVGRYLWTALAGRVMEPGCKADMALVLQGAQGLMKSTAVATIPPDRGWFRELSLHTLDADLSRKLRGCVVAELAELRGLRSRESEAIKAWVAQQEERWTPKYLERETSFQRRCVLIGTSNPEGFLDDETGERRWLPLACRGRLAVDDLLADRDQLWAEGLFMWELNGIDWREAEQLAQAEHVKFKVRDSWSDLIGPALTTPYDVSGVSYQERGWVQLIELAPLVSRGSANLSRADELRLGKVLRGLGWSPKTVRPDNGPPLWAWAPNL